MTDHTAPDLLEQARQVVLAYAEANPMRTADMHPMKCGCLRCEIDRLDYAADIAASRASAVDGLVVQLKNLLAVYSEPDRQMCCNGHMCGCQGASVYQEAEHYARAAIIEWENRHD